MSMEMGWCWLILRGCGMFHMRSHPAEVNGSCLSPNQPFSQSAIMVRYDHGVASHVSESPSPEMLLQTLEPIREVCEPLSLSPHVRDSYTLPS